MNASKLFTDTCPEQARFLMQKQQMAAPALPDNILCQFCYQWRQPSEYHVRLRPKCRPSGRISNLLRKEVAHKRLSAKQARHLQRFRRSSSFLLATCYTCSKTSRQFGANRDFLKPLRISCATPSSAVRCKTPQSSTSNKATPKLGFQETTPNRTPLFKSTETSSSSKSASGKKSTFSRLKKLLMVEDNRKNTNKGDLKSFLTSL